LKKYFYYDITITKKIVEMNKQTFDEKLIDTFGGELARTCTVFGIFTKTVNDINYRKIFGMTGSQKWAAVEKNGWVFEAVNKFDFEILTRNLYSSKNMIDGERYIRIAKTICGKYENRFMSFPDVAVMDKLAANGWEIHDYVNGAQPLAVAVDIDLPTSQDDIINENGSVLVMVDIIIAQFLDFLNNYVVGEPISEPLIYGYDNEKKHSRHIIFKDAIVETGSDLNFIIKEVNKMFSAWSKFTYGDDFDPTNIIDENIGNNKSFCMRFPHCSKDGDFSRVIKPMSDNCKKAPKYYKLQNMLQRPNINLDDIKPIKSSVEKVSVNFSATDNSKLDLLVSKIGKLYPDFTVFRHVENSFIFNRPAETFCYACNKKHSASKAAVHYYDGKYKLCCFMAINQKNYKCIVREHPDYTGGCDIIDDLENGIKCDEYSSIKQDKASFVSGKYCNDVIEDDFVNSYVISAVWGSGKSWFIKNAIDQAKASGKNILCVSSRITLSIQQSHTWGLKNYDEFSGKLNQDENKYTNWQIESLGSRVDPTKIKNTVLIIDEITALGSHCSARDAMNQRYGLYVLGQLLNVCDRYIVSDNDISEIQVSALVKAAPHIIPKVYRNIYSNFSKAQVTIYSGNDCHIIGEHEIFRKIYTENNKRIKGLPYEGVCVAHHSKAAVNRFVHIFKSMYPADMIMSYTSETGKDVKREDFGNATAAWAGKLCVIYSPTVSIGISAELANFKTVYGIYSSTMMTAQQAAQALFRCRNVENIKLFMHQTPNPDSEQYPETGAEFLNWVRRDRMPSDLNGGYSCLFNPLDSPEMAYEYLNNFVGNIFINAKIQEFRSKNNFIREIKHIFNVARIDTFEHKTYKVDDSSFVKMNKPTNKLYFADNGDIFISKSLSMILHGSKSKKQAEANLARSYGIAFAMYENAEVTRGENSTSANMSIIGQVALSIAGICKVTAITPTIDDIKQTAFNVTIAEKLRKPIEDAKKYIKFIKEKRTSHDEGDIYGKVVRTDYEIFECVKSIIGDQVEKIYAQEPIVVSEQCIAEKYNAHNNYIIDNALRLYGSKHSKELKKHIAENEIDTKFQLRVLNIALGKAGIEIALQRNKSREFTGNYIVKCSAIHSEHKKKTESGDVIICQPNPFSNLFRVDSDI
jgi:hypothetical protein